MSKLIVTTSWDNGYLPALKELIKELMIEKWVLFTGTLYGEDKIKAYIDADVYVLPSIYEAFPTTVLEACACGVPVITTDRCGTGDIIIESQAGIVIPYDKEQLIRALLSMLSDEKMKQHFREKGKLLVYEKFNWSKIAENVERIYLDCTNSGKWKGAR